MEYEIHFAVELPFWMALPATEFTVVVDGAAHRVKTSNEVVRIDVGDFYRRPAGYLVKWVRESDLAATTPQLEAEYPDLPVFQRKAMTVVTHIRNISSPDDSSVQAGYDGEAERWTEESIAVINRFIDWYRTSVPGVGNKEVAINVSRWEVPSAIVSFWSVGEELSQIGGTIQPLRHTALAPPSPMSQQDLREFEEGLAGGSQPPVVASLLFAAGTLIPRGSYRNAIVDAVTALEVAVEEAVRKLARKRDLPDDVVDYLLHRPRFEDLSKRLIPALGGPRLATEKRKLWQRILSARKKRHSILHEAATATEIDALHALTACTEAALKLTQNT